MTTTTTYMIGSTMLTEPIAAMDKPHQQLPPQRSLQQHQPVNATMQSPPLQKVKENRTDINSDMHVNEHNVIANHTESTMRGGEEETQKEQPEKKSKEEQRGSALVAEIMRRLSRAQPALPSHHINILDTSNLSEDVIVEAEEQQKMEQQNSNVNTVQRKLSDLSILRVPVPPSILKNSSEAIPRKVEGRKIQFIDPILSNSSSEVDSLSNASSSLLEQTPDRHTSVEPKDGAGLFVINNSNKDYERQEQQQQQQEEEQENNTIPTFERENTPLRESDVIVDTNVTLLPHSSSPAFSSLQSTPLPHQEHDNVKTYTQPSAEHATPSQTLQVHLLMETNRSNKHEKRLSSSPQTKETVITIPKEILPAAPLPARPRMSRERSTRYKVNNNNNNNNKIDAEKNLKEHSKVNVVESKNTEPRGEIIPAPVNIIAKSKSVEEEEKQEQQHNKPEEYKSPNANVNSATRVLHFNNDNNKQKKVIEERENREEEKTIESNGSGSNSSSNSNSSGNSNSSNSSSNNSSKNNTSNSKSNSETQFSIPPFRHTHPPVSSSNHQVHERDLMTREELLEQLQKYEAEVKLHSERSLWPTSNKTEKAEHVANPQTVSSAVTVKESSPQKQYVEKEELEEEKKIGNIATSTTRDATVEREPNVNVSDELQHEQEQEQEQEQQQEYAKNQCMAVEVPVPPTNISLTPKIKHSLPQCTYADDHNGSRNNIEKEPEKTEHQSVSNEVVMEYQKLPQLQQEEQQRLNKKEEQVNANINENTEYILELLLYNQLLGSKNKHSLEYLMREWERRQKRDLAKRMREIRDFDSHQKHSPKRESSKRHKNKKNNNTSRKASQKLQQKLSPERKINNKSQTSAEKTQASKRKHHSKDNKNNNNEEKTNEHRLHKQHKDHRHHHHHHHHHHDKEQNAADKSKNKKYNINKELQTEKDINNQKGEGVEEQQWEGINEDIAAITDAATFNEIENKQNHTYNDISDIHHIEQEKEELQYPNYYKQEEESKHFTDYTSLSLHELKEAVRRNGLEFVEKTKLWETRYEHAPLFTNRSSPSLYHDKGNVDRPKMNSYAYERERRAALREKYLGRRSISPSATLNSIDRTRPGHYAPPMDSTNSSLHYTRTELPLHTNTTTSMWSRARQSTPETHSAIFYHNRYPPSNKNTRTEYQGDEWDKETIPNSTKQYFNNYNHGNNNNNNNNTNNQLRDVNVDEDEVHSYHSYQANDDVNHQLYRSSSYFSPCRQRPESIQTLYSTVNSTSAQNIHFAAPLSSPALDTDNSSVSSHERVESISNRNLPIYEVRDLPAASEFASGVRNIVQSLKSYIGAQ